jgi:prepilin-type N-terminal cleavage/methylation domain-containing protein
MKKYQKDQGSKGFTLMEVVVSIGILAVTLPTIAGTISYCNNRAAATGHDARATGLLDAMLSDLRFVMRGGRPTTAIHGITVPKSVPATEEMFFDAEGVQVEGMDGAFYRCRLEFRPDESSTSLIHLQARVTWPAAAPEGREKGSTELVTSILKP